MIDLARVQSGHRRFIQRHRQAVSLELEIAKVQALRQAQSNPGFTPRSPRGLATAPKETEFMALLRFYARADLLVSLPGARPLPGESPRYVGRFRVAGEPNKGGAKYPALREAFECDSDSDTGRRLVKLTRRDASLWCADAETARECGVEFVRIEFSEAEGAWTPAARVAAPAPSLAKVIEKKAAE